MLVKCEQNRMDQSTWNFELYDKKKKTKQKQKQKQKNKKNPDFYNHFGQRVYVILEDVSVAEIIV